MRRFGLTVGAALIGLLAGCVPPPPDETDATAKLTAPIAPPPAYVEPTLPPPPVSAPPPEPEAPPPPPEPEVDSDPARLMGMEDDALRGLLGQPVFVRSDGPALLWRYRTGGCLLDLFLYRDGDDDDSPFRVRHVEARTGNNATTAVRDCFADLLKARPRA